MEVILMIKIILFCSLIEINFVPLKGKDRIFCLFSCFNFHCHGSIRTVNMTIIYDCIFFFQILGDCPRLVDSRLTTLF